MFHIIDHFAANVWKQVSTFFPYDLLTFPWTRKIRPVKNNLMFIIPARVTNGSRVVTFFYFFYFSIFYFLRFLQTDSTLFMRYISKNDLLSSPHTHTYTYHKYLGRVRYSWILAFSPGITGFWIYFQGSRIWHYFPWLPDLVFYFIFCDLQYIFPGIRNFEINPK